MAKLVAIVRVDEDHRVRCGEAGCGRPVYAAIHLVDDGGTLLVLGSTCFTKRYGNGAPLGHPSYGEGDGRLLTDEERQMLVDNTAALLAQFEHERQQELNRANSTRLPSVVRPTPQLSAQFSPTVVQPSNKTHWNWMKPGSSMAYFRLNDGTGWVRVQHRDSRQILVPWPAFEGWEEALPARLGVPEPGLGGLALHDVVVAVRYLRENGGWDKVCGFWRELVETSNRENAPGTCS